MASISAAELSKHQSKESCWLVIYGKVYDVTSFLNSHPGGAKVLVRAAGRDSTPDFESVHNEDVLSELPPSACIGSVDLGALKDLGSNSSATKEILHDDPKNEYPPLSTIVNVDDFEVVAKKYLSPTGWAYYASAADDEYSKQENRRIFRKIKLRPRVLRNVDVVDTTTTILGHKCALPVYISPTGLGKYAHPGAECTLARAAGKEGLAQCVPTSPSMSLEAIYGARLSKEQPIFQQLYVNRDREKATALIKRAVNLGATALFVTVDSPVLGKREQDDRLKGETASNYTGIAKVASSGLLNPALTWADLKWIRALTDVPIVLKGIQSVEDAVLAHKAGVQGIVLSNHGGRSQDTAQAPMLTLLEIRKYAPWLIRGKMQIFVDGGIRRGTDILKALALGANAVGVGRSFLYSMTGGYGEAGVQKLVDILRTELHSNMALAGATRIDDIVPEMVNAKRLDTEVFDSPKL
ncbi:hypothetical protein Plec18167_005406 [Paecilomyces lecythidis]|uniref:Uncharacterized protein n=1 Tax=Paecilomyces lecythidis TaxID=3004212 RepID=A0ABR3XJN6_9EURO